MKKLNKKGFTLVELLAVIVILALLMVVVATTALPAMNKSKLTALETYAARLVEKSKEKCFVETCADSTSYDVADLMGAKAEESYTGTLTITDTANELKVNGTITSADGKFSVTVTDSVVGTAAEVTS